MKKVYVTPVMESEAFVANEYVAACYNVKCAQDDVAGRLCNYPERLIKTGDWTLSEWLDKNGDESFHKGDESHFASFSREREDVNEYYHKPSVGHHHLLDVSLVNNKVHPNISV